ncbi:interleukin-6 [Acipenser oxyrinchus oxyrinchus]|uniref:Interleukin-6 n=1 Tax=Acipenser oxyrinchus oxyrinchus TaxID=40147 RepID=A0AAD8LRF5_ACIOX|nr:interleukin-6 [Acipenser oxyrinchus oxyrinchus]
MFWTDLGVYRNLPLSSSFPPDLHGFVLALLVVSLSPWLVRAAPIVEFSGDDSSESFQDNQLSTNWESLAEWLHSEVLKLRDQQFRDVFNLTINNSYLSLYTIKLPQITVADGCLSSAFKTENCLRTIATGLQEYLQYMDYVKDSYTSGKDEIEKVCDTIQNLSADVFQRVKNPQSVTKLEMNTKDILSHSSDSEWGRAVNVHVILREFTNFMEKTYIAIRHINE